MKLLLWVSLLLCWCGIHPAHSATFYVDASAPTDSGAGTRESPKKYIASGIALMSSGDTLILEDGIYTGTSNMIGLVPPRRFPPAGTAEHYTVIKARSVGGAIIDAEYSDIPFTNANQANPVAAYLAIDGIHFRRGNAGVFQIKGRYHKVTNCGFEDGQSPTDHRQFPIADIIGSASSYVLFEDCWAWGKGRYGIYFGGSSPGVDHSIFRRVVVRQDDAATGPVSGIMFYNGHDNACQNCIIIDCTDTSTSEHYGAFAATANYPLTGPTTLNHQVVGSIALNNAKLNGYQPQYNIGTFTLKDTVLWGNGKSGIETGANTIGITSADQLTIGANTVDGISSNPTYTKSFIDVKDTLAVKNGRYGLRYARTANRVISYGNRSGEALGTKITSGSTSDPFPALKYLPRIENSSGSKGAGANVLYQIGTTGALYGDAGWNEVTAKPLWPLPNEAMWAAKMKGYTASGPGGNRGFAAVNTPTPLTDYVWGYIGNTVPPFNVKAVAVGKGVEVSWDAARANANLSGYKIYVGTSSRTYRLAGYKGGRRVGKATSEVLDLPAGRTYFISVTALDKVKGESGYSYEVVTDTSRR